MLWMFSSYIHIICCFETIWCQSILGQSDCWSYQYRHCDSTHLHYLLKGLVLYSLMFQNGLVFNYDHNISRVPLEKEFQKQKMKNANKVEYYKHLWRKEVCFVVMRSTKPGCFRLCSWCLWKLLMRRGALAWFHNVWTCSAKVLEYWMISSLKIMEFIW
jgi:hypothetical protein